jgi:hypothetical protein
MTRLGTPPDTRISTTTRCAGASKAIAGPIAAALGGNASVVVLPPWGQAYIELERETGFRENIEPISCDV